MGIINRSLLFICALLLAALAVLGLGAALTVLPEATWLAQVRWALAQKETVLVLAILLLVGLHLLGVSCSRRHEQASQFDRGEVMTLATEHGEVQVALVAIRNLLARTLTEVHGVRQADVHAVVQRARKGEDAALRIKVNLVLGREAVVQDAGAAVQQRAAEVLTNTFGLADVPVQVRVADVTDAPMKGRRVV